MASGNEHRMVFDIRGKRRHVVKVVYAILAVLMGASLFLVVGPVNIGSLLGGNNGSEANLAQEYEQRAEKIELELKKSPGNEELLAKLTNARMNAGKQSYTTTESGELAPTVEVRNNFQQAGSAWTEYAEASQSPSPPLAQQMAGVFFTLSQLSRTYNEAQANLEAAAEAQKVYAEQRPSLNSLSTQALYTVYTGNYKEAEEVLTTAEAKANSKFQREQLGNQFGSAKKSAVEFQAKLKTAEKAQEEAAKGNGGKAESLENPGSVLGGAGLTE
jgi:hypothetical protein